MLCDDAVPTLFECLDNVESHQDYENQEIDPLQIPYQDIYYQNSTQELPVSMITQSSNQSIELLDSTDQELVSVRQQHSNRAQDYVHQRLEQLRPPKPDIRHHNSSKELSGSTIAESSNQNVEIVNSTDQNLLSSSQAGSCIPNGSLKAAEQLTPALSNRKRRIRYPGDLIGKELTTEEKARALPKVQKQLQRTQTTVKQLRSKIRRLEDKLESMEDLLSKLKSKQLLSDTVKTLLERNKSNDTLFQELLMRKKDEPCSESLRAFATTLHFYSAKAYRYVRQVFHGSLPHERTIIRWYVTVEGEPGITGETLAALKIKADEKATRGEPLLGCLIMDEMAIRQHVEWNQHSKRLEGVVQNNGNEIPNHSLPAKGALVFMVTGVQESWSVPVAYFLTAGMNAEAQRNTIEIVLRSLHEAGVKIISLTFDGTATNISTANAMGCNLKPIPSRPLKTSFKHPCADYDIFVLLDAVHMLKLVRNTLHARQTLITDNGTVRWSFIKDLNDLQNRTGNRLAPKLTDKHLNFQNSEMKVSLAVQVISQSVASALSILNESDDSFKDCEATVEFLSLFNDLFDIFNSMNTNAEGFKRPLSPENIDLYRRVFEYVEEFIKSIKLSDGTPVLNSRNKTGFLGFLINIQSFRDMFRIYVEENQIIEQLYTYRFSQDHIEMFFGSVRAKGGCNNNPSSTHFKAIYKRLITNNDITCSAKANCSQFNNTKHIFASHTAVKPQEEHENSIKAQHNDLFAEPSIDEVMKPVQSFPKDKFYAAAMDRYALDVRKKLLPKIECRECLEAIAIDNSLITAVCSLTDQEFKELVGERHDVNIEKYYEAIVSKTFLNAQANFDNTCESFLDHWTSGDHHLNIIKRTICLFLNTKCSEYSKGIIAFKQTNRQKLTKLILFEGN